MNNIPEFHVKDDSYKVELSQLQNVKSTWRGKMVNIGTEGHKIKVKYNDVLNNIAKEMSPDEAIKVFKELKVNKAPGFFSSSEGRQRRIIMNNLIEKKYGSQNAIFENPLNYSDALKNGYNIQLLPSNVKKSSTFKTATLTDKMVLHLNGLLKKSKINSENLQSGKIYYKINSSADKLKRGFIIDLTDKNLTTAFANSLSRELNSLVSKDNLKCTYVLLIQDKGGKFYVNSGNSNKFKIFDNEKSAKAYFQKLKEM